MEGMDSTEGTEGMDGAGNEGGRRFVRFVGFVVPVFYPQMNGKNGDGRRGGAPRMKRNRHE